MIKLTMTYISDLMIKIILIVAIYFALGWMISSQDKRLSYQAQLDESAKIQRLNKGVEARNNNEYYHLNEKDMFRVEDLESMIRNFVEQQNELVLTEKSIEQNTRAARQLLINPDRSIFVYEVNIGFIGHFLDLKMILYQLSQVEKMIIIKDVVFDSGDFPINKAKVSFYVFAT